MCVFSKPVESVTDTKILVAKLYGVNLGKQLSVYQNHVKLGSTPSAMILTFPNPQGLDGQITMVDLSGYKDIFVELDNLFPKMQSRGGYGSKGMSRGIDFAAPKLEIKKCGDYEYSVANTLDDLNRLDWEHYEADENVRALLSKHYGVDFGFLVCKCTKNGEYSPIGVVHPALEKHLYVPTMHEHGSATHEFSDWSHQVFAVNAAEHAKRYLITTLHQAVAFERKDVPVVAQNLGEKMDLLPQGFLGCPFGNKLSMYTIVGNQGNGDLYLADFHAPIDTEPKCCTYGITGDTYVHQPMYRCATCVPQATIDLVLCEYCAQQHQAAGHRVGNPTISTFFCDRVGNKSL